ncbi:MAG: PEP-CTERM sorting domain-containing protein [Candidatus Omnitrophica bacterium]|nr:PEP-CTERM sorting domain-containing protein [Candidatus Omnitrophota bacterium]
MKKLLLMVILFGAGLLIATQAHALTFVDVVDPEPDVALSMFNPSYTFTHNILDHGFNPATNTITSANISIRFWDQGFDWIATENATISFDGNNDVANFEVDTGTYSYLVNAAYLQNDGLLNVTITRTWGNFWFEDSTLTVNANASSVVPEPISLLLMGSGLVGLFGLRRKV